MGAAKVGTKVSRDGSWTRIPETRGLRCSECGKVATPESSPTPGKGESLPPISRSDNPIAIASEFVALSENIELEAYPDPMTGGDPWTIGFGTTRYPDGRWVKPGDRCTKNEALSWLNDYLKRCSNQHFKEIPHWQQMTAHQQAALLSLSYNDGYSYGDGKHDSLDAALREKHWTEIPTLMMQYRDRGTNVELGLGRRRHAEGLLWQGKSAAEAYKVGWAIDSVAEFA